MSEGRITFDIRLNSDGASSTTDTLPGNTKGNGGAIAPVLITVHSGTTATTEPTVSNTCMCFWAWSGRSVQMWWRNAGAASIQTRYFFVPHGIFKLNANGGYDSTLTAYKQYDVPGNSTTAITMEFITPPPVSESTGKNKYLTRSIIGGIFSSAYTQSSTATALKNAGGYYSTIGEAINLVCPLAPFSGGTSSENQCVPYSYNWGAKYLYDGSGISQTFMEEWGYNASFSRSTGVTSSAALSYYPYTGNTLSSGMTMTWSGYHQYNCCQVVYAFRVKSGYDVATNGQTVASYGMFQFTGTTGATRSIARGICPSQTGAILYDPAYQGSNAYLEVYLRSYSGSTWTPWIRASGTTTAIKLGTTPSSLNFYVYFPAPASFVVYYQFNYTIGPLNISDSVSTQVVINWKKNGQTTIAETINFTVTNSSQTYTGQKTLGGYYKGGSMMIAGAKCSAINGTSLSYTMDSDKDAAKIISNTTSTRITFNFRHNF